jgi:hypothetical protein
MSSLRSFCFPVAVLVGWIFLAGYVLSAFASFGQALPAQGRVPTTVAASANAEQLISRR